MRLTTAQLGVEYHARGEGAPVKDRCADLGIGATSYREQMVKAFGPDWWAQSKTRALRAAKAKSKGETIRPITAQVLEAERIAVEDGATFQGRNKALGCGPVVYKKRMVGAYGHHWWERMIHRNRCTARAKPRPRIDAQWAKRAPDLEPAVESSPSLDAQLDAALRQNGYSEEAIEDAMMQWTIGEKLSSLRAFERGDEEAES